MQQRPGAPSRHRAPRQTALLAEAATRVPLALAGVGAAVVLQSSWGTVRFPYDAVLVLVIVIGAVHGVLGWAPRLRIPARLDVSSVLGYGPVLLLYLLLTPERLGSSDGAVLGTRLGCGIVLATIVHAVLHRRGDAGARAERPVAPGWRGVAVLALVPGLVAGLVLVVHGAPGTQSARPGDSVALVVGGEPALEEVAAGLTFPTDGPAAVPGEAQAAPADPGNPSTTAAVNPGAPAASDTSAPAKKATTPAANPAATTSSTVAPVRPVRILISGESTAGATGGGIKTWGKKTGRAEVEVVGSNACALQQDGVAVLREGWTQPGNGNCLHLIDYTVEVAGTFKPDLIVLFIGSNQLSNWLLPGEEVARHIGQATFDEMYSSAATRALRRLSSVGVPVLFTTTPVPAWDPAVQTGNPNVPGTGPIYMNDAGRTRRLNQLTAGVVRGLPLTAMAPYAERISNPDGTVPGSIRPDGVHVLQQAVPGIMERGLEADLRGAYQQVTARVATSARAGHHWSRA